MLSLAISGATTVAAVTGRPVSHSLSPAIHNAWIKAASLDAVYVALSPPLGGFAAFANGLRGGVMKGLNVTAPFKHDALAVADEVSDRAQRAGAANLLIFKDDAKIAADNTDGEGLLAAFAEQAPGFDPAAGPVVIYGAGGAGRGALAAFLDAGAPQARLVARSPERAQALAEHFGPRVSVASIAQADRAFADAGAIINATPASIEAPLTSAPLAAVVMDMVYRPLHTTLLSEASARGMRTVDGLAMLIGQARPSFAAFFGRPPPDFDVREVALKTLEAQK